MTIREQQPFSIAKSIEEVDFVCVQNEKNAERTINKLLHPD